MSIDIHIDVARRVVFTSLRGAIQESDVLSVAEMLLRKSAFDPTFDHVIDLSGTTSLAISTAFAQSFARTKSIFSSKVRQVIVAPHDHVFGMASMARTLRELEAPNMKVEVVRSRDEACRLLGLDDIIST